MESFTNSAVGEWVVICWAYVALAAYMILLVVEIHKRCRNHWKVRPIFSQEHGDEAEDFKVTEKALELKEERHMHYARHATSLGAPCLALPLLLVLYTKHSDWTSNKHETGQDLHVGHMPLNIAAVVFHCFFMICSTQPGFTFRTGIHAFVLTKLSMTSIFYKCGPQLVFDMTYALIARMLAALVFGNFKATCLLNIIYATITCGKFYSLYMEDDSIKALFGDDCLQWFFVQQLLLAGILCSICKSFESRMFIEAKTTIKARTARSFLKAVEILLNTMYSVVINLDKDLNIVGESSDLAAFLLHGPNRSLTGTHLQDYLYDAEDRESFEAYMKKQATAQDRQDVLQDVPTSIRLRMRDSSSSPLYVELLKSTIKDIDQSCRHVLGVREIEVDAPVAAEDSPRPQLEAEAQAHAAARTEQPRQDLTRGTPHITDRADLIGRSEISEARISYMPRLLVDDVRETPQRTRVASMVQLLISWNIEVQASFCCSHHAMAFEALKVLRQIKKSPCFDLRELIGPWQCQKCAMLARSAEEAGVGQDGRCMWCARL